MFQIYAHLSMSTDELAAQVVDHCDDPEEVLTFLIRCDELVADLDFTTRLHARLGEAIEAERDEQAPDSEHPHGYWEAGDYG